MNNEQDTYVLTEEESSQAQKIADQPVKEIGLEALANREQLRHLPIRKYRETYRVPFEMIQPRPGFNVRFDMGNIEELADGIAAAGFQTEPLDVDILTDGLAYINDGHRRHLAFGVLRTRGHVIADIECFINDRGISEEDRIVSMFVTQNNKKLEPLEIAACLMRLHKKGWTIVKIAERIGKSPKYVKNYLRIERQPGPLKELIAQSGMGIGDAQDIISSFPNEAERVKFVEQNLLPLANEGEKIAVVKKGTPTFMWERMRRLQEMEGIFNNAMRQKINKLLSYLKGEIDEVDLVNL